MRDRRHVLDQSDLESDGFQRADSGFPSGTGSFDEHLNRFQTVIDRDLSGDADCAANGVDFLDPLKPSSPADAHEIALPSASEMVTIVLLKVD